MMTKGSDSGVASWPRIEWHSSTYYSAFANLNRGCPGTDGSGEGEREAGVHHRATAKHDETRRVLNFSCCLCSVFFRMTFRWGIVGNVARESQLRPRQASWVWSRRSLYMGGGLDRTPTGTSKGQRTSCVLPNSTLR